MNIAVKYLMILLILIPKTVNADVLYVHNFERIHFLTGQETGTTKAAYDNKYIIFDVQKTYTGEWMRRFYGKEKQDRHTTIFLLDKREVREISWDINKILVYPLENIKNLSWLQGSIVPATDLMSRPSSERFEVKKPVITISKLPGIHQIGNYQCQQFKVVLLLETYDQKKQSSSITEINQLLYLSNQVPGLSEKLESEKILAEQLGIDTARLGNLSSVLEYWNESLEPLRESLNQLEGYPVKILSELYAKYIYQDKQEKKEISKLIKKEIITLENVIEEIPEEMKTIPQDFREIFIK
ncbi:MAG: hypothetical protein WHS38_06940 [Thermodesulforhabdaceae bacterium]